MAMILTPVVNLDRHAPIRMTDSELDAAIARRNIAYARMQDAREWLDATAEDALDIRARRRDVNDAQLEYEHASRDLVRASVLYRSGR